MTCPECGGSGEFDRIDVWSIDCFVCKGRGWICGPKVGASGQQTTEQPGSDLRVLQSVEQATPE